MDNYRIPEEALEPVKCFNEPLETEIERAKRLLEWAGNLDADNINGTIYPEEKREMLDCASKLLAEDQYEAVVIVLSRMSGRPARQVRRLLKLKLGVEK